MSSSIAPTTSYYPETTDPTVAGNTNSNSNSTAQVAKEQAASVGSEAKASGQHVAGVAKDQAAGVAGEARRQAADLLHSGRGEVRHQVSAQQQRAATGIRSLGDELMSMANGQGGSGLAADLVHEVSTRASSVATWLEAREPSDVLDEVTAFARRRPGTFLAIAAGIGVIGGRLTRGMAANASAGHAGQSAPMHDASPVGTAMPTTFDVDSVHTAGYTPQPLDVRSQPAGTVYPTGTPAYGTEPLDVPNTSASTDVFGEPRRGVTP